MNALETLAVIAFFGILALMLVSLGIMIGASYAG